jgi:hypothetical protein
MRRLRARQADLRPLPLRDVLREESPLSGRVRQLQAAQAPLCPGRVQALPRRAVSGLSVKANPLPDEVLRLACSMFAGHTGLDRDRLVMFLRAQGVDMADLEREGSRRAVLRSALERMDRKTQIQVLGRLSQYPGSMRHGYPTREHQAELLQWLQENGWKRSGPDLAR